MKDKISLDNLDLDGYLHDIEQKLSAELEQQKASIRREAVEE